MIAFAILCWINSFIMAQEVYEAPQYPQYVQYPQGAPPVTPGAPVTLSADQLDQLLAPIALYPDPLLSLIFPAATYPQDIAAAEQWLSATPNVTESAIDAQNWDPSIKGLLHYPTVLKMMSVQIDWTQTLGAAFLNQRQDVLNSVQRLRARAQALNNLQSGPQEQVITDGNAIRIEPVDPNTLYVPTYTRRSSITPRLPLPSASAFRSGYGSITISIGAHRILSWATAGIIDGITRRNGIGIRPHGTIGPRAPAPTSGRGSGLPIAPRPGLRPRSSDIWALIGSADQSSAIMPWLCRTERRSLPSDVVRCRRHPETSSGATTREKKSSAPTTGPAPRPLGRRRQSMQFRSAAASPLLRPFAKVSLRHAPRHRPRDPLPITHSTADRAAPPARKAPAATRRHITDEATIKENKSMYSRISQRLSMRLACALALGAIAGCDSGTAVKSNIPPVKAALIRPAGEPGVGQRQFDTDDQAAAALVAAAKARDSKALDQIFGPSAAEFVSGDKVEDEKAFDNFVTRAGEHMELEKKNADTSFIDIGKDNWPFPIPLTRLSSGKWFFDTEAGKQEILARRIGANELETIKVCRAYVEAQREYASADRDGSGVLKYAQHFLSKHGKDGLYWPAAVGEEQSPFGPLIAQATQEGYTPGKKETAGPQPYHGYVYRILTAQGPAAPGGKYDYIINGNMIAGFALVAYPKEPGVSGVMTFIISHNGKLYQKDLDPATVETARSMKEYNPDASWTLVTD
ncbi:MAG TPA: DUF2950 family protein [Tepidisphaeraceae bacterium]|nr:DUF2950 family protein [Tepidisphaeraceae bacterium]